jgi:hypothetical protein
MTHAPILTGGCQCGAVRFRIEGGLGRASICHCRMCQKATGNFFAPLVTAKGVVWTREQPARFRSSNKVQRGFCPRCGTPLTFEPDGREHIEVFIGALDDPEAAPPAIQVGEESTLSYFRSLHNLPVRTPEEKAKLAPHYAGIISRQHPDRETENTKHTDGDQ